MYFGDVNNNRRYYQLCRLSQIANGDPDTADIWAAKLAEAPGTALPATFPLRSVLVAAGYGKVEDFDGASQDELVFTLGLTTAQATSVLAAYAAL